MFRLTGAILLFLILRSTARTSADTITRVTELRPTTSIVKVHVPQDAGSRGGVLES
jgi:hypothetical protein